MLGEGGQRDERGYATMHVLLNASNIGASGPRVVLQNLVPQMGRLAAGARFTLLLPSSETGEDWDLPPNIGVRTLRRTRPQEFGRAWDVSVGISSLCRQLEADVCVTLGDLGPVDPGVPHVIFLHQPYLVYQDAYLNRLLPPFERWKLRFQRWHFRRSAREARAIIVQTPVMADRLMRMFSVDEGKVHVIPGAVPAHVRRLDRATVQPDPRMLSVAAPVRLLFLATYYAHKNHVILPPLVAELRRRGLVGKVHVFLTLHGDRRRAETALLRELGSAGDIVTNLGPLSPEAVGRALVTGDALFLPTLVETFGLIYLEAMACGMRVLTSDRDFARWMCGDLAEYFDPSDPASIADAIERFVAGGNGSRHEARAKARLADFPENWDAVARAYLQVIEEHAQC